MVRGMLAAAPAEVVDRYTARRYIAFTSYPMREYVEILAHACEAASDLKRRRMSAPLGFDAAGERARGVDGTATCGGAATRGVEPTRVPPCRHLGKA
jgi:hypothetical protein